jgi:hypothetical protein
MHFFFDTKALFTSFVIGIFLFSSCETDIDIISDEGDVPVVYGLLNPDLETQYIKVNKTYAGEEDAAVLAQDPANLNYPEGTLNVMLQAYEGSRSVGDPLLAKRTENQVVKDKGYFASSSNILYAFDTKGANVLSKDTGITYRLTITNSSTGERLTSETKIVSDFSRAFLTTPRSSPTLADLSFANGKGGFLNYDFAWTTIKHAKRYELTMIIRYREVEINGGVDTSDFITLEFPIGAASSVTTLGGEKLSIPFKGETFYRRLNEYFTKKEEKRRLIESIDFRFVVGGQEINTYVLVNQPSLGIVQEKPEYSNITNGLGIFSTRREFYFPGYFLDDKSVNELVGKGSGTGSYTREVGLIICMRLKNSASYTCN